MASTTSPSVIELDGPFAHEFVHTRGVRLHVVTAGSKQDPLVVLVHGGFGGWFDFREVIAPLADQGFHVAAVDLRGTGMSDKPPVEPGQDIRTLVGDLTGLVQALGHTSAFFIGDDTGGAVAWAVATSRPERTRGLVSIAAAHPVDMRHSIAARPWDFTWISLRALTCRVYQPFGRTSYLLSPATYRKALQLNVEPTLSDATFNRSLELRTLASQIGNAHRGILWNHRMLTAVVPFKWVDTKAHCPVLFLHADQQLWKPVIRHASRRVRGDFVSQNIPGTKNLPHLEDPEQFVHVVSQWLRAT